MAPEAKPGPRAPQMPEAHHTFSISARRVVYWAWQTVSVARVRFVANLGTSILVQQLSLYKSQLLVTVIALLASGGVRPTAGQGQDAAGGFLTRFMPHDLATAAILFAALAAVVVPLQFGDRVLSTSTDMVMLGRLQQRLHDRLLILGSNFHQRVGLSDATMIVTRYAMTMQSLMREVASFPFVRGLTLLTAMIYLLNSLSMLGNPPAWVSVMLVGIVVLFPIVGWGLSNFLRSAFQRSTLAEMALAKEFANSDVLPLEIQAMGANEQRAKVFAARIADAVRAKVHASIRNEVAFQFENAAPDFIQAGLLIYGVFQTLSLDNIHDRAIAGAAIVGLIQFVPQVMSPVRQMIDMANMVNTLWPQVELAIQVLEVESEIKEAPNPQQLPPGPLPVEVEDLVYKPSPDGPPILQHLSVAVMPGEVWAISGRSGSGKSTLLNLMARLREYQSGTVRLGGCDIRNVAFASLRRSVGMVSQFPLIINDTARANLKLARADATDRELEAVCRSVGVWDSLQNAAPLGGSGLDAQLYTESNKGTLSGGQRRLFAIARALLNEPGLLILDEPTTGVDPLTRLPLENVVRSHSKGRTVIMVDQDPGFVAALADKVACLENGKVADVVSKAEFLTKPSLFLQLYKANLRSSEAQMRVVPIFDMNGQSAAAADGQTKPQ
jgi:ABC-type multidrug transport system fused ATPase/permease subunit